MVCKKCSAWNDDSAKFCSKCGGELYKSTMVTSPIHGRVAPTAIPTSGVRAFSGIGNGYLQSVVNSTLSTSEAAARSDTYHSYPTHARIIPRSDGTWICPDCGELNGHEKLYCTGCGRYR